MGGAKSLEIKRSELFQGKMEVQRELRGMFSVRSSSLIIVSGSAS